MDKTALKWIAGILLLLWLVLGSLFLKNYFCGDRTAQTSDAAAPAVTAPVTGFSAADGDFSVNADSYFRFAENSANPEPLSEKLEDVLRNTADYLQNNVAKLLTITGWYDESEENTTLFPDLGFARANSIKERLKSLGVPAEQLVTDGDIADADNLQDGLITNGITFNFSETDGTDTRLGRINENILGNPLTVYFETGDVTLNLTSEQKDELSDMVYYLDRVEGSKLEIGGHTDSQGDDRTNMRISRERAQTVSEYLTGAGVTTEKMNAVGFGETKPIGDNRYEPGRRQNRRVEIILRDS